MTNSSVFVQTLYIYVLCKMFWLLQTENRCTERWAAMTRSTDLEHLLFITVNLTVGGAVTAIVSSLLTVFPLLDHWSRRFRVTTPCCLGYRIYSLTPWRCPSGYLPLPAWQGSGPFVLYKIPTLVEASRSYYYPHPHPEGVRVTSKDEGNKLELNISL